MRNQAMARKLSNEDAIDIEKITVHGTEKDAADPQLAGAFKIDPLQFVDDRDYCVSSSEEWIWSIGRRRSDGAVFAALDGRFYQNPEFECLWLR